jgi:hypothetical protein
MFRSQFSSYVRNVETIGNLENIAKAFPITPNLLRNTRYFEWSDGENENVWIENTLPQFWGWLNATRDEGDTEFKAKTISVVNQQAWTEEKLPPITQVPLLRRTYGANYTRALLLDITRSRGLTVFLSQDCHFFTAWHAGNFAVTMKFYFTVLEREGDVRMTLPGNRFPTYWIGGQEPGRWHYVTLHGEGFGGCVQGYLQGSGRLKIAILLPFVTFGFLPEDIHVWAGFLGSEGAPYSHGDIVIRSSALAKSTK